MKTKMVEIKNRLYECENCKYELKGPDVSNYCPNCGSKITGFTFVGA